MVSEYFSESTLKSALSKAKHEFDLAAEMVQLIEQGMVQTDVGDREENCRQHFVTNIKQSTQNSDCRIGKWPVDHFYAIRLL